MDREELEKNKTQEKEYSLKREIISTILYLLVVVALTFLFVRYVGQRTHVNGSSMNVTLEDGDNLIVDKISYRFKDPERFDIIVFPYQYKEDTYYIKRIIGLPGETVQVIDGMVYIDGELLDESYGKEVMNSAGVALNPIELGEDEYFVLGDNRSESYDSRNEDMGCIRSENFLGYVRAIVWPPERIGFID